MKKILIVDDEPISLMMTEHILANEYQTVCASSGEEAIEVFHKESPVMVLSDLHMSGMSGFELQQKLQKDYPGTIPFMFMTADTDEEAESRGFENGALDYIRKPFRADVLLRRVGKIFQTVEQIQGLKKAADTDPMTGLLNKTSSQTEIGSLCRTMPGVLMMIDLDSFKLVNDLYGHDMGDKILIRFAEIIRAAVRSSDLVGRMGGDEFIAFCQNVSDETILAEKARYINDEIVASAKRFMGDDLSIPLGASIGCVFAPEEGTDFSELFKKADKALYSVKHNGKHGYAIFHDSNVETPEESETPGGLFHTLQTMGERQHNKGAFLLPPDQFRTIYRFIRRVLINYPDYKKEIWAILFTLEEKEPLSASVEDAAEEFSSILTASLRHSDVVTQSGKNQFMIILLETHQMYLNVVIDRIRQNWSEFAISDSWSFSYETEQLTNRP